MSVCIKGFKMPTCCYFCPMLEINQYSEAYCEAVGESTIIKCTYGEKPDFCPLVEVEDKELMATNVQSVKRGHWEEHHATYIKQLDAWFVQAKCSCCGRYSDKMDNYSQYLDLEYCSHCGARMMKEGDTNG